MAVRGAATAQSNPVSPPAGTTPSELEKRRAALQQQLAAVALDWSPKAAETRKALQAELKQLEAKPPPKAAPAPATPAPPSTPAVDPRVVAESRIRMQLQNLGSPYRGGTDPQSLAKELVARTVDRLGTDEDFVYRALELAHAKGEVKELNAAVGKLLAERHKNADVARHPDDGYLRWVIADEMSGSEAQRAVDYLETGADRSGAGASSYLLEGVQKPLDAIGDALHDRPLATLGVMAGVTAAGVAVGAAAPVVAAAAGVAAAGYAVGSLAYKLVQLAGASSQQERAHLLVETGSAAANAAMAAPGFAGVSTLKAAYQSARGAETLGEGAWQMVSYGSKLKTAAPAAQLQAQTASQAMEASATPGKVVQAGSEPVSLEGGTTYVKNVQWNGQTHEVRITVDRSDIARELADQHRRFDLDTFEAVTPSGERVPMFNITNASAEYAKQTGAAAPPFLTRISSPGVESVPYAPDSVRDAYVLPTRVHLGASGLGVDDGITRFKLFSLTGDTKRAPLPAAAFEPFVTPAGGFATREIAPGVKVTAASQQSLDEAVKTVNEVMGNALKSPVSRDALGKWKQLEALNSELPKPPLLGTPSPTQQAGVAAWVAKVKSLLAPEDATAWTLEDAKNAVAAQQAQAARIATTQVEIVAVPVGKHLSAMPQWQALHVKEDVTHALGINIVELTRTDGGVGTRTVVFAPEGNSFTFRHELRHMLFDTFLSDAQRATVDDAWFDAIAGKGAAARAYGLQRNEFFTTWGEVFDGASGQRGIDFMKSNVLAVFNILREAEGVPK